ncbi:hypothetical protein K490DRAFT_31564 [Saccharata proteae CBS 121410]|uniref:DUF1330 domain-containing protein n=1 Tax=Saccharata proteae CBS 121410 TaxID=1314787 RepID=A0A9P4LZV2_9PEZI|nr:hypothetical protein K490DRAFT_31564 [Saccharata proteae CBS 121410]
MPVCALHLLALNTSITEFLSALTSASITPLVISRVVRWIITPTAISVDPLLSKHIHWDLLIILPSASDLPAALKPQIAVQWTVQAGVPSRLVNNFAATNARLLAPQTGDVPALTGALDQPRVADSAQALELSSELQEWIQRFGHQEGAGAVSMLNLLAFKPGMKDEYLKYGAAFAKSIGARRGGNAKIVGSVVQDGYGKGVGVGQDGRIWDEVALAHYPSIWHFADMLASKDYQEVNHRHRVPSLRDTFILCTTELGIPGRNDGAKL